MPSQNSSPALPLPDRLRLPLAFDAACMAAEVAAIPAEDWIAHFVQQNYEGGWSVVPLRCAAGATHPILMAAANPGVTEYADTPWLQRAPYLAQVLAQFACPLQSVRLMRLEPGSRIKPHNDHELAAEWGTARLHVPVTTNPDVDFRLNGVRVDMALGSTWYLRLADEHSITNDGTAARVHLVIDCTVNPWLQDLLDRAARA